MNTSSQNTGIEIKLTKEPGAILDKPVLELLATAIDESREACAISDAQVARKK